MADVGTLTAKLTLDTAEFSSGASQIESLANGLSSSIGGVFSGLAATVGAAVGSAATAVGSLVKDAVGSFSDYQQLVGGVETMFKDSADVVQEYAQRAYETAGISANQYMEQVTSFSASLIASLDGDTSKAAETANMAITDMADNANKMGSTIESIQNAYQGFAKQNYTMLDNLKLGYGGTKEEMQRLLADAEKFSGIHYDISNLNDVYNAIHVIQEELGITETTAEEASSTISGSFNMVKAAWDNVLTSIAGGGPALEQTVSEFTQSVSTFASNIIPVISTALKGVGQLVQNLAPIISAELPGLVSEVVPMLTEAIMTMTRSIISVLPQIVSTISQAISGMSSELVEVFMALLDILMNDILPEVITLGMKIVTELGNGIAGNVGHLSDSLANLIGFLVDTIVANLPTLLSVGLNILMALAEGISRNFGKIMGSLIQLIGFIASTILSNLPKIIEIGLTFILGIVQGINQNIHKIADTIINAIPQIVDAITASLPIFLKIGVQIILQVAAGILLAIPSLVVSFLQAIGVLEKSAKDTHQNVTTILDDTYTDTTTTLDSISSSFESSTKIFNSDAQSLLDASDRSAEEIDRATSRIIGTGNVAQKTANDITSGIIVSANNAKDGVADAINQIVDDLADAASRIEAYCRDINSAFSSIQAPTINVSSNISGARASGGSVSASQTYLVGEQGPELFTPNRSGYIYNNDETMDMLGGSGGISIVIQGDVYDDERSMRNKMRAAILDVMEAQFA